MSVTVGSRYMSVWTYWQGEMNHAVAECRDSIRRFHPDAKHLGPQDIPGDILRATEGLHIAKRADLLRLWLLKTYGGMWIDSDVLLMQAIPYEHLLDQYVDKQVIGFHNGTHKLPNTVLIGRQGAAFFDNAYRRAMQRATTGSHQGWTALGASLLTRMMRESPKDVLRLSRHRIYALHHGGTAHFLEPVRQARKYTHPKAWGYHLTGGVAKELSAGGDRRAMLSRDTLFAHLAKQSKENA